MTGVPRFALADWGTSRLRIWLVDEGGSVLASRRSDDGMAACRAGGPARFASVFEGELAALDAPADLPAVICGMAGARGGWREAGYLSLPASPADLAANAVTIDGARPISIVPGISQNDPADVMRGEEIQIFGSGIGDGLLCLPGTHSKLVRLEGGRVTRFSTVMTGELFDVLSHHSLLAASLDADAPVAGDDPHFLQAVRQMAGEAANLSSALFSIRAGSVLQDVPPAANAARLSGLLIGAELASLERGADPVHLIADDRLARLYEAALQATGRDCLRIDAQAATLAGLVSAARQIHSETA